MVRVIERYQCGICQATFDTKADAEACEAQGRPRPRFAAGTIVTAGAGYGWYDGQRAWVVNPDIRVKPIKCPNGNGNCFEPCCTYQFYYAVTAVELVFDDLYPAGERHRTRYHVFTEAMTGKQGHRSGHTYDYYHVTLHRVAAPPAAVRDGAQALLGQKATALL